MGQVENRIQVCARELLPYAKSRSPSQGKRPRSLLSEDVEVWRNAGISTSRFDRLDASSTCKAGKLNDGVSTSLLRQAQHTQRTSFSLHSEALPISPALSLRSLSLSKGRRVEGSAKGRCKLSGAPRNKCEDLLAGSFHVERVPLASGGNLKPGLARHDLRIRPAVYKSENQDIS